VSEFSPEKRILLAFALAILVLLGWSYYMRTVYPPQEPDATPQQAQAPPEAKPEAPAAKPVVAPAAVVVPPPAAAPEVKQGSEERLVTVETDTATIVFSTRGAVVRSWRLKDYRDAARQPVELVQGSTTHRGFPLSLRLQDRELEQRVNDALFVLSPDVADLQAPGELTFEWSDGHVAVRKRFRFERGYSVGLDTHVLREGKPLSTAWAWRGGFGEHTGPENTSGGLEAQVFVRAEQKLLRQPARQAGQESGWMWRSPSPFPNPAGFYGGIEDRYFTALFLPRQPPLLVSAWREEWKPEGQEKSQPLGAVAVTVDTGPIQLFVGPKEIGVLEQLQAPALPDGRVPDLAEELVDFGWFWWVAKPLFLMMTWMYESWLPNYGWVIVVLTIAINLLLFPLRWKSMESSFKMQKAAPQIKAIQDRYKQYKFNDPRKQKMQEEIMALYRQHGINPLGGCLPLVLQLPFFYGFYKVLAISIEMRHAPWMLWIRDLSQKDPYYVLPVTMAVTMYLSMKMTPMTMTDPRQQKMMQMMMLVFAFAFLQVSSGLVLYWLVSSVVGLVQQVWINRWRAKHDLAEKEAARESKKKKRKRGEEDEA